MEMYKMIYKIDSNKNTSNLRILGEDFVKNNINKGKLIISNKKSFFKGVISINNIKTNKLKMILCKSIYNKSCMFKDCKWLESLSLLPNNNDIKYSVNEEKRTEIHENSNYLTEKEEVNSLNNLGNNDVNSSLYDMT